MSSAWKSKAYISVDAAFYMYMVSWDSYTWAPLYPVRSRSSSATMPLCFSMERPLVNNEYIYSGTPSTSSWQKTILCLLVLPGSCWGSAITEANPRRSLTAARLPAALKICACDQASRYGLCGRLEHFLCIPRGVGVQPERQVRIRNRVLAHQVICTSPQCWMIDGEHQERGL